MVLPEMVNKDEYKTGILSQAMVSVYLSVCLSPIAL